MEYVAYDAKKYKKIGLLAFAQKPYLLAFSPRFDGSDGKGSDADAIRREEISHQN